MQMFCKNKSCNILVIADCHSLEYDELKKIEPLVYDACFLLGDINGKYLDWILQFVPKNKVFGILGNHDTRDLFGKRNIENIHLKTVNINGYSFLGFEGSSKYKNSDIFPMYTQDESVALLNAAPKADILISHDFPFEFYGKNTGKHSGLKGITEYLKKNKCLLHIHGHLHKNSRKKLRRTTVISVYRCCLIDLKNKKVTNIF